MTCDGNARFFTFTLLFLALVSNPLLEIHAVERSQRQPLPPAGEITQLPPDGGPEFNRLIHSGSPYLLQHARNPVDWYPWGDEAFETARTEDKLVFLSIGYSACHWCHVMEHESFEDDEVAALMNEYYISVKVDREERPDIDEVYMTVTQMMTGHGGWPMTVILTPDRKPVFAGTYFPKQGRPGVPGMMQLLPQIGQVWKSDREKVLESAEKITSFLVDNMVAAPGDIDAEALMQQAFDQHVATFDAQRGGFGDAPKFPTPHRLTFLLRHWYRTGDGEALAMTEKTLDEMRRGGMYDQVGFGFHRYSVDAEWLVPHFEKMLYDQALLAFAYLEAWQATGKEAYARTVREIMTYVLRDMTAPEGAFYSAEDADSEGEEGKFYLWTTDEVKAILGPERGQRYISCFNLAPEGNWQEGYEKQTNIPHLSMSIEEFAQSMNQDPAALRAELDADRLKLFGVRERRIHPMKDDKILTDWNGLMIAAMAAAGRALDEPDYTAAAEKAAQFILKTLRAPDGRLLHRYRAGQAGLPAHLEDHAFMTWALIELYESTFKTEHLESAITLTELSLEHYADDVEGGFFQTADDGEVLLVRPKSAYDGAIPSGNSVMANNLYRLGRLLAKPEWEERGRSVAQAFGAILQRSPSNFTQMLNALAFGLGPAYEVVVAGVPDAEDTRDMLRALNTAYLPNRVLLFRPEGEGGAITKLAEYTESQKPIGGKATAYICQNYACSAPGTEITQMMNLLESDRNLSKE